MLSEDKIAELYAPRSDKPRTGSKGIKQGKGFVMVRNEGELEKQTITKMGDHDFGSFVGKVGSMRRSSKGASRRMPNGRRKYESGWWLEDRVIAYKLKPR